MTVVMLPIHERQVDVRLLDGGLVCILLQNLLVRISSSGYSIWNYSYNESIVEFHECINPKGWAYIKFNVTLNPFNKTLVKIDSLIRIPITTKKCPECRQYFGA